MVYIIIILLLAQGLEQSEVNTSCSQTEIQETIWHVLYRTGIPCTRCVIVYLTRYTSRMATEG